jgi:hypothetical protein
MPGVRSVARKGVKGDPPFDCAAETASEVSGVLLHF